MKQVVPRILSPVAGGLVVVLAGLYVAFRKDWKYMRELRKTFIAGDTKGNCECYLCCGLLKVFCGYFFCFCRFKNNVKNILQNDEDRSHEIKSWGQFLNSKTTSITRKNLQAMKKSYVNYKYSHKYYCYKHGVKCLPSACEHYPVSKWKGLLKHPTLYLTVLNFDELIQKCDITMDPLEVAFNVIGKDYKSKVIYQNVKNRLGEKIKKICLVLENFPKRSRANLTDNEKFLLESVLKLYHEYGIQLIYNYR